MSNVDRHLNSYMTQLHDLLDCFCKKTNDKILCSLKETIREHLNDDKHKQLSVLFYITAVSLHHAYSGKNADDPLKGQPLPIDIKEQLERILRKEKFKATINITLLTIYVLGLLGLLLYASKDVIISALDTLWNKNTSAAASIYMTDSPMQNKIIGTLFSDKGLLILGVTIIAVLSLPGVYRRFKEHLEMIKQVSHNINHSKLHASLQELIQYCKQL